MTNQETLYYFTHPESLTYHEALQTFDKFCDDNQIAETTILAYGPDKLLFDGRAEIMAKRQYPLFQLRAFNSGAELRWNRTQGKKGTCIVITDNKPSEKDPGTLLEELYDHKPLTRNYLVWGRYDKNTHKLFDGRIGHITIPDHVIKEREYDSRTRLYISAKEYISTDEYGNAYVFEERLTALEMGRKS